jgi:hypothetical protein
MPQTKDRSNSIIVKIPKLYSEKVPECLCWFEAGVIYIESCEGDGEVTSCSVAEFEERLKVIQSYILDGDFHKLVCGKERAHQFLTDAHKLVTQAKQQLHVGMPLETISAEESSRRPVTKTSGFGNGRYESVLTSPGYSAGFRQISSGLYVPTHQ